MCGRSQARADSAARRGTDRTPARRPGPPGLRGASPVSGRCPFGQRSLPLLATVRTSRWVPKARTITVISVVYQGGSMPTYLSPGVYVEEVDSGSRPIEGVGTAVAAFVGLAEDGPFNAPTLVPNWTEYTRNFGGFVEGSYLAQSVYAYFQNGGGNCYV